MPSPPRTTWFGLTNHHTKVNDQSLLNVTEKAETKSRPGGDDENEIYDGNRKGAHYYSDMFTPITDHARLYSRSCLIDTYDKRRDLIYFKSLQWQRYRQTVGPAEDEVRYKAMKWRAKFLRRCYIISSLGGLIPQMWYALSNVMITVMAFAVSGIMSRLETVAEGYQNDSASWFANVHDWWMTFTRMMVFVVAIYLIIKFVEYVVIFTKTDKQLFNETRFAEIAARYRSINPYMPAYELEYNSDEDPDIAMMYFMLRETKDYDAQSDACGARGSRRVRRLLALNLEKVNWPTLS